MCRAVELDPGQVSRRLSDGVCSKHPISDSLGREQVANFVNEDGLYDVILDSRKSEARAFRKWITSEVLPAIRRTGGYIAAREEESEADLMARALSVAQRTLEARRQRIQMLEGERDILQKENAAMAPKAQYTDDILQSTTTVTFTEMAKELGFRGAVAFTDRLVADRIVYRQCERLLPYARYSDKGYFAARTYRFFRSNGEPDCNVRTVITQKGRMFLHEHFHVDIQPVDLTDPNVKGEEGAL